MTPPKGGVFAWQEEQWPEKRADGETMRNNYSGERARLHQQLGKLRRQIIDPCFHELPDFPMQIIQRDRFVVQEYLLYRIVVEPNLRQPVLLPQTLDNQLEIRK